MKKVVRPWGDFKEFCKNKKCTVKILEVKPRHTLSLQVHKKREEMWYFFTGALVQIGDDVQKVKSGDIIKVSRGKMHRILAGWRKVKFLEIAFGNFSELDEVRLEDDYGRK